MRANDFLTERATELETLKKNKVSLTDEERKIVMDKKAVWHHGQNGKASPAVWKSENSKGNTKFVTNTHRAYQVRDTLKGAINAYHNGIKQSA